MLKSYYAVIERRDFVDIGNGFPQDIGYFDVVELISESVDKLLAKMRSFGNDCIVFTNEIQAQRFALSQTVEKLTYALQQPYTAIKHKEMLWEN